MSSCTPRLRSRVVNSVEMPILCRFLGCLEKWAVMQRVHTNLAVDWPYTCVSNRKPSATQVNPSHATAQLAPWPTIVCLAGTSKGHHLIGMLYTFSTMLPLAVFRMHKVHNGPGRPSAVLRQAVDVKLCPAILQLFLSKVHCHCA